MNISCLSLCISDAAMKETIVPWSMELPLNMSNAVFKTQTTLSPSLEDQNKATLTVPINLPFCEGSHTSENA